LYWKLISKVRRPVGRRQTSKEVQELIFRMVVENPYFRRGWSFGEAQGSCGVLAKDSATLSSIPAPFAEP